MVSPIVEPTLESKLASAFDLSRLPETRDADFSLLDWLREHQADAYEEALHLCWQRWQAMTYPMRTPRCLSAAVTTFCEYAAHAHLKRSVITEDKLPVPVFLLGHKIAIGHYDPDAFRKADFLPNDLVLHLILSKKDYDDARTDLLEQISILFVGEIFGNGFPEHEPFIQPKGRSKEDRVRDAMSWVMRLPLLSTSDVSILQNALASSGPIDLSRLPAELSLAIESTLNQVPVTRSDTLLPNRELAAKFGGDLLSTVAAYPVFMSRDRIWVITPDSSNYKIADKFSSVVRQQVCLVRCGSEGLHRLLQGERQEKPVTTAQTSGTVSVTGERRAKFAVDPREFERASQNLFENIDYLLKWMLCEAMRRGASDIHIDQFNGECRIRCQVDGSLVPLLTQPEMRKGPIKSKIQQWADIRLDGREPAEGHFTFSFSARDIDVRVALVYSNGAEPKFTLRLLDKTLALRSLSDLGLAASDMKLLREHITKKQGIIITSGPTGAGKSTTMAAMLMEVNSPDKAIYTLEDPIEYVLPGVTQIQSSSDLTKVSASRPSFADGAKLLLRHAPDIIMIGEIRDNATAKAASELAITGHLVISTVHANDVLTVLDRLRGKEVDARDLSAGLRLITSQRLIRRLCKCNRVHEPDQAMVDHFASRGVSFPEGRRRVCVPIGCPDCNHTGYKGRMSVLESLVVTHEIRDLIADSEKNSVIRAAALKNGYVPLYAQGLQKVVAGHTSLQEVCRHIEP